MFGRQKYLKVATTEVESKVEQQEILELKNKINHLINENNQANETTQRYIRHATIIFSIILVAVAVLSVFYINNNNNINNGNNNDNLYNDNNQVEEYNNQKDNPITPQLSLPQQQEIDEEKEQEEEKIEAEIISPSSSVVPSTSSSLSTSLSNSPHVVVAVSPSIAQSAAKPPSASYTPAPSQEIMAVIYDGKVFWDGRYDTFPEPVSAEFSGPASPEAQGKYAYMTMITGYGRNEDQYPCLGLALLTSLQKTNPDPSIDVLVILLIADNDDRFRGIKEGTPEFEAITPQKILGDLFYDALIKAGVNKWVIWRELETDGRDGMAGGWKQAFTKLRFWSLVQYDKVVFLDADTMIFKNLDHLFNEPEFTTAATWNCKNANSPKKPSGGFWVFHPSLNTWGLIQKYIEGRDPCANKWRLGDMTMTWVLFVDVSELRFNTPETWQKYDGDHTRWGRCHEKNIWPARFDFMAERANYDKPEGVVPPKDIWRLLNDSYDILVPICDDIGFYTNKKDDRYNFLRGEGMNRFDRPDAFTVHYSCGHKPRCRKHHQEYNSLAACARDMFDQWYDMLHVYYPPPSPSPPPSPPAVTG